MLDFTCQVETISNFKRNTSRLIKQMKRSGNPIVLTANGEPRLVVQHVAAYERLKILADKVEMTEFLRERGSNPS